MSARSRECEQRVVLVVLRILDPSLDRVSITLTEFFPDTVVEGGWLYCVCVQGGRLTPNCGGGELVGGGDWKFCCAALEIAQIVPKIQFLALKLQKSGRFCTRNLSNCTVCPRNCTPWATNDSSSRILHVDYTKFSIQVQFLMKDSPYN
jgi:hypothetical protein